MEISLNQFSIWQAIQSPCVDPLFNQSNLAANAEVKGHKVARFEKPEIYPLRQQVLDHQISWSSSYPNYNPEYYVAPVVLKNDQTINPKGWAEPENLNLLHGKEYKSLEAEVQFDEQGFPLNPRGRTGLKGRGLLGKWGANFAADPIVTRINPQTKKLEILLIERVDCGQWALPGGMVDDGEKVTKTLARELSEETGIELQFENALVVYQGYVDDRRNTDNAWMETIAAHLHLPEQEIDRHAKPVAGDDAKKARWVELQPNLKLYASHNDFVKNALENFLAENLPQEAKMQIAAFLSFNQ